MNYTKIKAITVMEIILIIVILIFVYMHVVKKMAADMGFSEIKRNTIVTVNNINNASQKIKKHSSFVNIFNNEEEITNLFAKELQAEKICKDAKEEGCWSNKWIFPENQKQGFEMPEGQYVITEYISSACLSNINIYHTCGALYIDTNGNKPPNEIGKDMIKLYITAKGIIPAGVEEDIFSPAKDCDMIDKFSWGCTAKLLGVN